MWTADPGALEQLRTIFKGTLSSRKVERSQAVDALKQAREEPEFENYLVDLLIRDEAGSDVRAAAGLNLKNSVLKEPRKDRPYVLDNIMNGLLVQDTMARNITGTVITSLFSLYGLEKWPQALQHLLSLAESADAGQLAKEAAMSALSKICEDSAYLLNKDFHGERPLNYMVPKFIKIAAQPESSSYMRAEAVRCVNQFVPLKTQLFLVHIDDFLHVLFQLALDSDSRVRKNVCTAFLLIMENRPDKLVPHMDGVVNYGLHSMQDSDEDVAMEACEFLLALAELPQKGHKQLFRPKLQQVLPVLLEKMMYSEEEQFLIQIADEKDDARVADKNEDIRPSAAKAKTHQVGRKGEPKKEQSAEPETSYDPDDDRVEDSDGSYTVQPLSDSDEDDDSDDELDSWNLRRCSAATLDALSIEYPEEVIEVTLPILQERIVSNEWPVREAAILAFGAISTSCEELASDKLPTLVPFLVDRLRDLEPRVRQISCWTVSRFALWVAGEAHEGGNYANYFQPTFESIVLCAMDSKKVVQEAACSALSVFIESTDISLISYYVGPLLDHFAKCLQVYQRKNMVTLYDCILTFVDKIGQDVFNSKPEYVSTLLPPLLHNWQVLQDTDSDLWPLLECMALVAATMGEAFAPYAVPVYERAVKILSNAVHLNQEVHTHPEIEAPEKDFIVTSLDLIDGLVQGFKGHSIDLMKQHGADLMKIVMVCLEDPDDDVRQLSYALLGDLAIHACEETIKPNFSTIIMWIGSEINGHTYAKYPVTSNAIWACGEMVLVVPKEIVQPQVWNISNLLITIINQPDVQLAVLENTAICLGRLGFAGPEIIGPRLPEFIYSWCTHMMYIQENEEKESAFLGMIEIILQNPDNGFGGLSNQQGRKNLAVFLDCIANYLGGSERLKHRFHQFLIGYRDLTGPNWAQVLALSSQDTQLVLRSYK